LNISEKENIELSLDKILKGSFVYRLNFDEKSLELLKKSVAEKGLLKPIIVRPIKTSNKLFNVLWSEVHYEIVDGERRYRCCKDLLFTHIRAVIMDVKDDEMFDLSMSDPDGEPLNPIEKAYVFRKLSHELGRTQEQIAKSFNLKQQQVSEYARLLEMPEVLRELTARAVLSLRHAREILKISDSETMVSVGLEVVEKKLSTRELTNLVKKIQFDNKMAASGSIKFEKIHQNDFIIDNISENPVKFEEDGVTKQEIKTILDSYKPNDAYFGEKVVVSETKEVNIVLFWLLEALGQLNSLILYGRLGIVIKKAIQKQIGFEKMRPEIYLAWIEICILTPSIIIYAIYQFYPLIALGLGSFFTSLYLFTKLQK
jgi:ParB family transcriptional regulator, chromosome partitioning protein